MGIDEPMILLFHAECGKPAFWLAEEIIRNFKLCDSTRARLLDGTIPKSGSKPVCGSCGTTIKKFTDKYLLEYLPIAGE